MLISFSLATLSTRFTEDVAKGTRESADLYREARKDMQVMQDLMGPESTLVTQLNQSLNSFQTLSQSLVTIEPSLGTLHASVECLTVTQSNFTEDLKACEGRLAEAQAQVQSSNSGLEKELSAQFAENTRLQLQVQKLSHEGDSLKRKLDANAAVVEDARRSMANVSAKLEAAEDRNRELENDKSTLQRDISLMMQQARDEQDKRATSSEQIKAQYEEQLRGLQQEKECFEKGTGELLSQLGGVRDCLVGMTLDSIRFLLTISRLKPKALSMITGESGNLWYTIYLRIHL